MSGMLRSDPDMRQRAMPSTFNISLKKAKLLQTVNVNEGCSRISDSTVSLSSYGCV